MRAWQWQSFFCSFTTQSARQRLKLPCGVMDNTQIHTKITHGHTHAQTHLQELSLELAHQYYARSICAHIYSRFSQTHTHMYTPSVSLHIKTECWTKQRSGRQLLWHETFPWYHFKHIEKKLKCFSCLFFSLDFSSSLSPPLFCFLFASSVNFTSPLLISKNIARLQMRPYVPVCVRVITCV